MKCVKCGREGEAAEFCGKCGAPQPGVVVSDRPAVVVERRRRKKLDGGPLGIAVAVLLGMVILWTLIYAVSG